MNNSNQEKQCQQRQPPEKMKKKMEHSKDANSLDRGRKKSFEKTKNNRSKTVVKVVELVQQPNTGLEGRKGSEGGGYEQIGVSGQQNGCQQVNPPPPPPPQTPVFVMNQTPVMQPPPSPVTGMPPMYGGGVPYYAQYQAPPQPPPPPPPPQASSSTEYQMLMHHLVTSLQEDIRQLNYRVKRLEDLSMASAYASTASTGGGGGAGGNTVASTVGGGGQKQPSQTISSSDNNNNNKSMELIVKMLQEMKNSSSQHQENSSTEKVKATGVGVGDGGGAGVQPPPPHLSPSSNPKEQLSKKSVGGEKVKGSAAGLISGKQEQPSLEVGKTASEEKKPKQVRNRSADPVGDVARLLKTEEKKTQNEVAKKTTQTVPETMAAKIERVRGKVKKAHK